MHLLVEAADSAALSAGMRGLVIRIARQVNKLLFRRGRFWADRWHGRALTSPRAVRHALVYVLANFRKHVQRSNARLDPYSSAPYFDGFSEYGGKAPFDSWGETRAHSQASSQPPPQPPPQPRPCLRAKTWLLAQSWRQRLFSVYDRPRGS